jgi:hypothetical protein
MPKCKCGIEPAPFRKYIGDLKFEDQCAFCYARVCATDELTRQDEVRRSTVDAIAVMEEAIARMRVANVIPDQVLMATWDVNIIMRDHTKALKLTGILGGLLLEQNSWDRRQQSDCSPDMTYRGRAAGTDATDIKIMGVPPPDTCRVEVEEVEIPAHKQKKFKVVCGDTKKEAAHA